MGYHECSCVMMLHDVAGTLAFLQARGAPWPHEDAPNDLRGHGGAESQLQSCKRGCGGGVTHCNASQEKLRPLEEQLKFESFYDTAELSAAYFTSKPMVLVLGQYSTGTARDVVCLCLFGFARD